jgi:hypothetical protein
MSKPWNGLVLLEEIKITNDITQEVVFYDKDLKNVLNVGGQSLILGCMFLNTAVPTIYYVGLDSRTSITANQTMTDISGEPSGNGYLRQPLNTGTNFEFVPLASPPKIRSTTVTFSATGVGYTASDMFLCNVNTGYSGILISSIPFGTTLTVNPGNTVSMKFAMTLGTC